jgi:hypothetical protein
MIMVKMWWYNWAEDKKLNEKELKDKERNFVDMVDSSVEDKNELEQYLILLTKENRDYYVESKTYGFKKDGRIYKILFRVFTILSYIVVPKLKGSDLITLTSTKSLYDSKNHRKRKKVIFQTGTSIVTTALVILIGNIAFKELLLNWANLFRFLLYLFSIVWTIFTTIIYAYRITEEETIDHILRLQHILDKYVSWKNSGGKIPEGGESDG